MIAILICVLVVILGDLIPLIRRRSVRGVIALLLVLIPATIMGIMHIRHIEVPSLMLAIDDFMRSWGLSY